MCGSSTTTTVKTGDLSDRGQNYESLFNAIMEQQFDNFGFDLTSTDQVVYEDQDQADQLLSQISGLDEKIAKLGNSPEDQKVKVQLLKQKDQLNSQLGKIPKSTNKNFELVKREDPRVLDAIEKYGADSPQVTEMKEQLKADELAKLDAMDNIDKQWVQQLNKFASGDMSFTPEQEKQVDMYIGPIKDIIKKTTDDLLTQYGDSDKALRSSLDELSKEIDNSGYAVFDALEAAKVQYEQSGVTLFDTLKKVNESNYARAKFEFDLLSEKADMQAAQQGAMLGLPPGSQSEKVAAAKMKNDALKSIQLELNQKEAAGALSIQQGVEQGKQNISLSKVALAENQGSKKEEVAKMGFGLTELFTKKIEDAMGNKANADIALQQQKSSMLYDAAYGGLPGRIQAGQQGLAFAQQQKDAKNADLQKMLSTVGGQLGVEQQRQLAETTTTTKQNKGFLDTFTDIVGAASSIAGMAMGIPGVGGGGGGGGGGAPQTYAPPPLDLDLSIYKNSTPGPFQLEY